MKIWIKYLIGCSLGILMAFFLPANQAGVKTVVRFFTELTVRTGRYFLIPVLFFGMTISITKLRETGKLLHTGLRIALCSVVITLIGTVLGIVSGLIVKLPRIPISVEKISDPVRLDIPARLLSLFPYNGISGLLDGSFLLPMCVLAGFIGASFASDNLKAKPALVLFDSLAKISYSVLSFFTDFIAIGMIAVSCSWAIVFFDILSSSSFLGLILLLLADTLIIIAGILPFLLRTLLHENRPYKVLFAALAPLIGALFSGDTNFVLALNLRHAKDSLGIRRRISTVSLQEAELHWLLPYRLLSFCVRIPVWIFMFRTFYGLPLCRLAFLFVWAPSPQAVLLPHLPCFAACMDGALNPVICF